MGSPALALTGSTEFSIPDIVKRAGEGSIRIPEFQRSFVWDAADVRSLFDSIYRGFPIGTVLLWSKEAPAAEIAFGPIKVKAPHRTDALWVVDGQQRIISLVGTLTPGWPDYDERFKVYFDFATHRFINPRRGIDPPRAIPINDALETKRLASWTRRHADDLQLEDYDVADRLVGAIRDYRIPAYVVAENDEVILREVFDRVNSAGKPITRAQVFHALFANDTIPGSPAVVVKELSRLGFGSIDENRVVQSLLAIRGGDVQRDFHDEFSNNDDPADWYDRTEEALAKAIRFLRSEGVDHISLMPYTLHLPVLAAFFHLHPEPSPWVRRLLARWLWRSSIQGQSGQTSALRKAVRAVNPKRLQPGIAPTEYEAAKSLLDLVSDDMPSNISLENFRTDQAWSRLILLALASLRPLRPNGETMDLAAEFERYGPAAVTEFVRGHRTSAASRGFWPTYDRKLTGTENEQVLASHAIDPAAAMKYRNKDPDGFLQERAHRLTTLVQDFLTNHLERGALVRPPLDELIVPESEI